MKLLMCTVLIIMLNSYLVQSQTQGQSNCVIKFTYDAAGNRIKRIESCGGSMQKAGDADLVTPPTDEASNETVMQRTEADLDIAVLFPNPTSTTCIVSLNKEVANATLSLYDNQGKQVHYTRVSGRDIPLNLSGFSAGSYIVIIRTESKSVHKTVVKN